MWNRPSRGPVSSVASNNATRRDMTVFSGCKTGLVGGGPLLSPDLPMSWPFKARRSTWLTSEDQCTATVCEDCTYRMPRAERSRHLKVMGVLTPDFAPHPNDFNFTQVIVCLSRPQRGQHHQITQTLRERRFWFGTPPGGDRPPTPPACPQRLFHRYFTENIQYG